MAELVDFVRKWKKSKEVTLKRCGFLSFERYFFTQNKMTSEGIKVMLNDRRAFLHLHKERKTTVRDYERLILDEYKRLNWLFRNGDLNPYAMLDWYKRRANVPDTPQPKRNIRGKKQAYAQMRIKSR